jgi:uncharacterized protein (DUF1501 family)
MVVPLEATAFDAYSRGRNTLALPKDSLLPIQDGAGSRYGFHPNLPGLRDLYNQNALAVVANVGHIAPERRIVGDASDFTREMQLRFLPGGYLAVPWALPGDASLDQSMPLAHGVSLASPEANPSQRRQMASAIAGAAPVAAMPDSPLGQKLATVLSALKTGAFQRQTFVVPMGGFAPNRNHLAVQAALFAELDEALVAFYRAVSQLGMAESITIYTDTEFNRALEPNQSGGADYAWGGHQFVLGGQTLGGRIYGKFPTMDLGGPDDAVGNGTWRPTISSARYAATLAHWYGRADLSGVPEYRASYDPAEPLLDFLAG